MAKHAGVSKSHVQKLWSRNDIKPHVRRTFKLSKDPNFEPKFWDIIALYLNPPHKALVLCCDEKRALPKTLFCSTASFAGVCWEPLLTTSGGG